MELPLLQILPCIVPFSEYSSSVINVCCASVLARVTDMMASHLRSSSFPWACLKQLLLCQISSSCLTRCMHSCSMCSDTRNNTSLLEHSVNVMDMWNTTNTACEQMWNMANTICGHAEIHGTFSHEAAELCGEVALQNLICRGRLWACWWSWCWRGCGISTLVNAGWEESLCCVEGFDGRV